MSTKKKKTAAKAEEVIIPEIIAEQNQLQSDRFAEIDKRLSELLERANRLEQSLNKITEKNVHSEKVTDMVVSGGKKDKDANQDVNKDEEAIDLELDEKNTNDADDTLDSAFLAELEALSLDTKDEVDEDDDGLAKHLEHVNLDKHDE